MHNILYLALKKGNMVNFYAPNDLWEALSGRLSNFVSSAYLLHSLRSESHIWFVDASWDGGVSHTIFGCL